MVIQNDSAVFPSFQQRRGEGKNCNQHDRKRTYKKKYCKKLIIKNGKKKESKDRKDRKNNKLQRTKEREEEKKLEDIN